MHRPCAASSLSVRTGQGSRTHEGHTEQTQGNLPEVPQLPSGTTSPGRGGWDVGPWSLHSPTAAGATDR